ncbi:MAG TPA: hypothetical protein VGM20_09955 [Gemmatimonadales bacterium]|jgi:hypothetical protein
MDEQQLDQALQQAARSWRVENDLPLDAIWERVLAEAFRAPSRRAPGWSAVGIAAAAALVIGVAGGRLWGRRSATPAVHTAATASGALIPAAANDPNQVEMGDLLGRTAVLLAALRTDSTARPFDPQLTREGARLLTTTRLLLDAPIGADPRLRNLLQDLELVLAQVARLEPEHRRDEIQFIRTAVDEHDIVPRLRTAAADLTQDEF